MTISEPADCGTDDPRAVTLMAVRADVVVLTIRSGQLSALLVRRQHEPQVGTWALPGRFVPAHQALEEVALQVLAECTGIRAFGGHLEQLRTYGSPSRDPRARAVAVAYLGLVPDLAVIDQEPDGAWARFWPVADLSAPDGPELAFDHAEVIAAGVERARAKLEYTPLAAAFVEEPFTLAELRRIYEAVWGRPVHPANFRRKVLSTEGFVIPLGQTAPAGPEGGRPADLYRRGPAQLLHPAMLRPPPERLAAVTDTDTNDL